jgi:hypothetical protein
MFNLVEKCGEELAECLDKTTAEVTWFQDKNVRVKLYIVHTVHFHLITHLLNQQMGPFLFII